MVQNIKIKERIKLKEKNNEQPPQEFEPVYCSFCGRPNTQVVKMVQGPGVNI